MVSLLLITLVHLTGFSIYASNLEEARKIADTHPHTSYCGGLEFRLIE